MTANRLVTLYSRALSVAGPVVLVAVLIADPRWTGQWSAMLVMLAAALGLRGAQVPLSKYSYLTQTGLVALSGSLLVGLPATAVAVALGVLAADWLWHKKMFRAALVNLGREVIALVSAYGVYAAALRVAEVTPPGLHVELVPALFFFVLSYFLFTRLLFYFALLIRGKLEQEERLLILRYECIAYGATVVAAAVLVGTVVYWPPLASVFVAAALGALGLLFKHTLEEAIAAEELNKIHAMEAVITSNISLRDSFARIERLAHRLVDWGDFRIYRRQEGALQLAYRGEIGRPERGDPTSDVAQLREQVTRSGEGVVIHDVTHDARVADAPLYIQSLVIVPLKFGDQVIGTLELEHHKRKVYRPKDVFTIYTFANQLATAIHITELRRPLLETVDTMTQQLATLARAAESMREAASAVAQSTGAIRQGALAEEGEVSGGLAATESLAQVSRRVSADGTEAAHASTTASEVANKNRQQIRGAIERLVALKSFVSEASTQVQQLGQVSRRITGFIASIRELADMTNLLALNAAIEAARAGKHGKGFAVVAEEVRRLAEQSATAALEAGELVQDIHRQVGEVVEQMRRGQVNVGGVEEVSASALEALDAIVAATAAATDHAQRIAAAAGEQDQAFGALRERIHAVAAIAGKNRAEADDVATRADEAAKGLTELERATRELEDVAAMLRELTRGFATIA
ncbi:MAG TPA: methyl-accepting chemotaxis protein [Gemmatimonadales bacterium]|nr:methyl-accepting chemotaxis protein [Gemmatimonadales bacterium]